MKTQQLIKILLDTIKNVFFNKSRLIYVTESSWSTKMDGYYITKYLNKFLESRPSISRFGIRNKIVLFGSVNKFLTNKGIRNIHKSNLVIMIWFHISPNDPRVKYIPLLNEKLDLLITSCELTKKQLINYGYKKKIIIIPIGVDTNIFVPISDHKKKCIKNDLNLPKDKIIIGSFQKDSVGWGKGLKPKLIKGPDIFCDVVQKLSNKFNIHVLLTGPARGYVKNRLEKMNISFTHYYLNNYFNIVKYYQVLDLCLVTSRAEGGPKAVLESMACGIPLVSTKVGISNDIIKNEINGMLCEVDDVKSIVNSAEKVLKNRKLRRNLINNALLDVKSYDWENIANQYYKTIGKTFCWRKNDIIKAGNKE